MTPFDVAKESYQLFREAGADRDTALAWLGNEAGETSFRIGVVGDKRNPDGSLRPPEEWAYDPAQHHKSRRDAILRGTGIDMVSAPHAEQIKGILWEMKEGAYKHVWPLLLAAPTLRAKVRVLVSKYEQSGSQERDINRRTNLANYWAARIQDDT